MENKDIREIIAKNISDLRKQNKLTQLELAEKLNYSDKAISRWERGNTLPNIDVLVQICELFGVTFDYLTTLNHGNQKPKNIEKAEITNKITIILLAISIVWFVATFVYVYAEIILNKKFWQAFIWAIPISAIITQLFCLKWNKSKNLYIILNSIFCWSFITAIYLQFLQYNLWLIYLLGIPSQVVIILWANLKTKKQK